jgi:hypothetical protein
VVQVFFSGKGEKKSVKNWETPGNNYLDNYIKSGYHVGSKDKKLIFVLIFYN